MTLQRAWRRRMRRGTPIWAKGWLVRRKKEKELRRQRCMPSWQKAALEAAKWRPFFTAKKGMRRAVSVASAAATFFSFSGFPQLIHLASAQSDISTTERTMARVFTSPSRSVIDRSIFKVRTGSRDRWLSEE